MQGNVTEYSAMDVMFGAELPHMGSMGHATSAFMDPGLEYTLGYSQVQLAIKPEIVHVTAIHRARCSIHLANPSSQQMRLTPT